MSDQNQNQNDLNNLTKEQLLSMHPKPTKLFESRSECKPTRSRIRRNGRRITVRLANAANCTPSNACELCRELHEDEVPNAVVQYVGICEKCKATNPTGTFQGHEVDVIYPNYEYDENEDS
jgi:hypothetical protein